MNGRAVSRRLGLGTALLILAMSAPVLAQGTPSPSKPGQAQPSQSKPAPPDKKAKAEPEVAECGIFEIEAKNDKAHVDPALKPLARKLKKPPFSSWKAFRLLKKHNQRLAKMKALSMGLETGGKMSLLYRDKSGGGDKKVRLRMTVQMDDKEGKRKLDGTLKIDSGDYSLIGGEELAGGGTYIVAITCAAKN